MSERNLLHVDGVRVGMSGAALPILSATGFSTSGFTVVLGALTGVRAGAVGQPGALLLGVAGWALHCRFGVNQLAELSFARTECRRLLAYAGCALLVGGDRLRTQ